MDHYGIWSLALHQKGSKENEDITLALAAVAGVALATPASGPGQGLRQDNECVTGTGITAGNEGWRQGHRSGIRLRSRALRAIVA